MRSKEGTKEVANSEGQDLPSNGFVRGTPTKRCTTAC